MAMLHAKKIAISVAYSIYIEVTEGNLDPTWKVEKPISFWDFRDKLSQQMLEYYPAQLLYPGDESMRAATVLPKKSRRSKANKSGRPSKKSKENSPIFVDKTDLCVEIEKNENERRLCGDLTCFSSHVHEFNNGKSCFCSQDILTFHSEYPQFVHLGKDHNNQLCLSSKKTIRKDIEHSFEEQDEIKTKILLSKIYKLPGHKCVTYESLAQIHKNHCPCI